MRRHALSTTTTLPRGRVLSEEEPASGPSTSELPSTFVAIGHCLPCHVGDADLWFSESPAELERAKRLCTDCPIRAQCLAGALERGEPWGVWGGEILEHGAVVSRKRGRGRPRKHAHTATGEEMR